MDLDEEEVKGGSSQIFCLTWIKRKAAKPVPDQIALTDTELKNLIKHKKVSDDDCSEDEDSTDKLEGSSDHNNFVNNDDNGDDGDNDDDDLKEFDLDNYDNETSEMFGETMSDLVVFASNEEDPYIKQDKEDDSDEEEKEDLTLNDQDNMLVCARCEKDYASLEVHLYNHESKDFYVHHDVSLSSAPLCMQWLDFDAGNVLDRCSSNKGNFVAIGNIDSVIDVWDIDVLNTLEPAYSLGVPKEKQDEYLARGKTKFGHTDAVLDLSWIPLARNKIATASVDHRVALWDLEKAKVEKFFKNHKEKVQTIEWKPDSVHCLLSGAFDGRIFALDTRSGASSSGNFKWKLKGEIEKVKWNLGDTNYFSASTDKGIIYYCDLRKPMKPLYNFQAHDEAIPALSMTSSLLVSGSSDGIVKVWKLGSTSAELLEEKNMKMGMVHCFHLNPDVMSLLAVGGERDGVKLWDVKTSMKKSHEEFSDINCNVKSWPKESESSSVKIETEIENKNKGKSPENDNEQENEIESKCAKTTKKRHKKSTMSKDAKDQSTFEESSVHTASNGRRKKRHKRNDSSSLLSPDHDSSGIRRKRMFPKQRRKLMRKLLQAENTG
ncbi:periodic tryptophan protein 1 homolog [Clavelina lepadiformis]|uniref:periodic tryptophan protein 1 homolog n=1 Tax=Clavelina lepadiformis TaxID=159417 RepID=UPI0040436CF0